MKAPKKQVNVIDLDFEQNAKLNDKSLFELFQFLCRRAKSLVPRTVKSNAYRVTFV
jgi:hypothetical protein